MDCRDRETDRSLYLFDQVKPELVKLLKNAPEYGSCGIDIVLHQGEVLRVIVRAEVSRKLEPRGDAR
jgi:hypothetical protein